jgi:Mrp family chromosome partitioning ATPase
MDISEEQFRLLRLRVQNDVDVPAFVVVGSALRRDGATYVACGLARAFAEAGYNTLLLDANARDSGIADELGFSIQAGAAKPERVERNLSVASLFKDEERVVTDAELTEMIAGVRWRYAMTIVDVPAIPGSGSALQLAQAADGVLVAVRLGRRPCEADRELKRLLERETGTRKRFTGIVPTHAVTRKPAPGVAREPIPPLTEVIGGLVPRIQRTS